MDTASTHTATTAFERSAGPAVVKAPRGEEPKSVPLASGGNGGAVSHFATLYEADQGDKDGSEGDDAKGSSVVKEEDGSIRALDEEGKAEVEGVETVEGGAEVDMAELEGLWPSGDAFTFEDDSVQGFFAHEDAVYSIAVCPSNPTVVCSGGGDDCAYLWDFTLGERLHKLEGHTDSVVDVAFNAGGTLVATAGMDATVKVWSVESGELATTLEGPGDAVEWIQWHEKADVILAGDSQGSTWMWRGAKEGTKWAMLNFFGGHVGRVTCGLFTPDGKLIVTASEDATVRVWDPKTADTLVHVKGHPFHEGPINCLAHHLHKPVVLTGGVDGEAILSSTTSGKVVGKFLGHEDSVEDVTFSPGHDWACTASLDHTVRVWDIHTASERAALRGHTDGVSRVIWHPHEHHLLYSGSLDNTLSLWDARVGEAVRSWKGPTDMILAFALSLDGNTILAGGEDTTVLVFNRS